MRTLRLPHFLLFLSSSSLVSLRHKRFLLSSHRLLTFLFFLAVCLRLLSLRSTGYDMNCPFFFRTMLCAGWTYSPGVRNVSPLLLPFESQVRSPSLSRTRFFFDCYGFSILSVPMREKTTCHEFSSTWSLQFRAFLGSRWLFGPGGRPADCSSEEIRLFFLFSSFFVFSFSLPALLYVSFFQGPVIPLNFAPISF